jgi:putative sterol carrier protein
MPNAQFLSEEWFEQVAKIAERAGSHGDVSARVQGVIAGGPDGEVKCCIVIEAGTLVTLEHGADADADLTLSVGYDDAVAIQTSKLRPTVAFMQGRMKTAGDPGVLLKLLPLTASADYEALRDRVNAATEY